MNIFRSIVATALLLLATPFARAEVDVSSIVSGNQTYGPLSQS